MKSINYLNYFFVGIPILLISSGFIIKPHQGNLIGYGLFSTIFTGIFQVTMGTKLLLDDPKNKYLQVYIISVVMFFFSYFIVSTTRCYNKTLISLMIAIPPILAFYFTFILFKIKQK